MKVQGIEVSDGDVASIETLVRARGGLVAFSHAELANACKENGVCGSTCLTVAQSKRVADRIVSRWKKAGRARFDGTYWRWIGS